MFVTLARHRSRKLSPTYPQHTLLKWISSSDLETKTYAYPQILWITSIVCGQLREFNVKQSYRIRNTIYNLWINLWIKGDKPVDKLVDDYVDNSHLWISLSLSTSHPQAVASCPQFCPQRRRGLSSICKANSEFIHTIHRPYYYY